VAAVTSSVMQEGVYFRSGQRPPPFFSLLLLRARDGNVQAAEASAFLESLWNLYAELKAGIVPDLRVPVRGHDPRPIRVPAGNLGVLLGFSNAAFELPGAAREAPTPLAENTFTRPEAGRRRANVASQPIAVPPPTPPGEEPDQGRKESGIGYADELIADTDPTRGYPSDGAPVLFAFQFTADSPLAVERAVVETWKLVHDTHDAPLQIAAVFGGTQRDDGRSWIDFYDGLSNVPPSVRESVIVIGGDPDEDVAEWTIGGTYLAFIRLGIDLGVWRDLGGGDPAKRDALQQRLVGRDKLFGCPLHFHVDDPDDNPGLLQRGCPVPGVLITDRDNPFRDPWWIPSDAVSGQTHMRRANQRLRAKDAESFRIFRQGYPFLEPRPPWPTEAELAAGFRTGLNFVSFQDTPHRLIGMLTTENWLGRTNFGGAGSGDPADEVKLVRAYAAEAFLVPPFAGGEPFPGAGALVG
jgi:deferrochelatase/peroxidase EfeB